MPRTSAKKKPKKIIPPPMLHNLDEGYHGERITKFHINLMVDIRKKGRAASGEQFYIMYLKRKASDDDFRYVSNADKYVDTTWPIINVTENEVNYYLKELSLLPKFKKISYLEEDEVEF
jgi:hypothetical protein